MRIMNYKLIALIMATSLLGYGCNDEDILINPGDTTPNSAAVSLLNFSVLFSQVDPTIVDPTTGNFTKTDIEVTAFIGDRSNQQITAPRTIFFKSEYGLIEPSCTTDATGSCSVTWSAIDRPGPLATDPGNDGFTTIVAYTTGEESFTDNNGNGIFDDLDSGIFNDQEEPYIDFELRSGLAGEGIFDGNDVVIDTKNGNDTTGKNGVHDIADGFFNGGGCKHSSLCSTTIRSPIIWTASANGIFGPPVPPVFSVGGTVTGLDVTESVTLRNNGANLVINADGNFTFPTGLDDGATYDVTVVAQPATQRCFVTNGSGTIVTADVTNVTVTCVNAYTVSGVLSNGVVGNVVFNITGVPEIAPTPEIIDITAAAAGTAFNFVTPVADGTDYTITITTQPGGGENCSFVGGTGNFITGTISGADVTGIDLQCL